MTDETFPPSPAEGPAADGLSVPPRHTDLATTQTMRSLRLCNVPFEDVDDADDMLAELHNALVTDTHGRALLFMHAQALDAFYHRLIAKALENPYDDKRRTLYVNDRMADLALRAQHQCMKTLATLSRLEKSTKRTEGGEK